MLVNANSMGQWPFNKVFGGRITDFNSEWFESIGETIVGAMKTQIYFPVLMALGYWGLKVVRRKIDLCFSKKDCETRCTT